jgi:hypothetical protein
MEVLEQLAEEIGGAGAQALERLIREDQGRFGEHGPQGGRETLFALAEFLGVVTALPGKTRRVQKGRHPRLEGRDVLPTEQGRPEQVLLDGAPGRSPRIREDQSHGESHWARPSGERE